MPGGLVHRKCEQDLLAAIVKRALVIGAAIGERQASLMEVGNLTDGDIPAVERELVDESLRDQDFGRRLAVWVATLVSTHKYRAVGERDELSVGIGADDAARLAGVIEEALR